eukprot:SAG31_NODE_68_length_28153_cov_23.647717_2_plen_226_part_00
MSGCLPETGGEYLDFWQIRELLRRETRWRLTEGQLIKLEGRLEANAPWDLEERLTAPALLDWLANCNMLLQHRLSQPVAAVRIQAAARRAAAERRYRIARFRQRVAARRLQTYFRAREARRQAERDVRTGRPVIEMARYLGIDPVKVSAASESNCVLTKACLTKHALCLIFLSRALATGGGASVVGGASDTLEVARWLGRSCRSDNGRSILASFCDGILHLRTPI